MAVDQKVYRRYHAAVERALALFDANSDWADYIAFLSRLLKSLDTGKPDGLTDIPCKARTALALSRCLQASLPAGVHQKALDVYNEIFTIIGTKGLARDLFLYLPGLSHTLAFANLATRPMILDLFEQHVLKLSPSALRAALKALILSLLPVIEEETSEDFDRCLHTFDSLRAHFASDHQESFFWQTLFVASVSNPLRRAGVLTYLSRFLPKLTAPEAEDKESAQTTKLFDVIITPEPGLLIRCVATGLGDDQSLVQRGFLDLLVTHLPLNAAILQSKAYRKDLDVLVMSVMKIVLRRDMSLNRRLWTWFTGTESKPADTQVVSPTEPVVKQLELCSDYFNNFGLVSVTQCLQTMISDHTALSGARTLPFRIMSSLMDRWELGGPVVKSSFSTMMKNLMVYQSSAPTQNAFDEVFRSANVFFDGIETVTLFQCASQLLKDNEIELLLFLVTNFNFAQADMVHIHVAGLCIDVAEKVVESGDRAGLLLALLSELVAVIPPASFRASDVSHFELATELLEAITSTMCSMLNKSADAVLLSSVCNSFERSVVISPSLSPIARTEILQSVRGFVKGPFDALFSNFATVEICSRILISLLQCFGELTKLIQAQVLDYIPDLVHQLWQYLSTTTPQYHIVVVESIWRLHDLSSEHGIVESKILELLTDEQDQPGSQADIRIEHFGILYHHSKTVKRSTDDAVPDMLRRASLYLIDSAQAEDRREPMVQWLLSLQTISPVLHAILEHQNQGTQGVALVLARVQKLVRILHMSEDHWRSFCTSPDMQIIYGFCLSIIKLGNEDCTDFAHDGFMLLRLLYGGRSENTAPEDLVFLLVDKLDQSTTGFTQQEDVLDTLLAILNEKSVLPPSLVRVLLQGLSSTPIDERLDKWITLLCNFLPNHTALLPSLLKVTSSFCKRIEQIFDDLQSLFNHKSTSSSAKNPERSIANLLSGLEYVLARAHQHVTQGVPANGHLANGATNEPVSSRSRANERLTVILCMQDAVKICARLWSWKSAPRSSAAGDGKSFQYTAMRIRSRSRKIMENLIEAEPQECLETLVGTWANEEGAPVLDLLQTLNGARPRAMLPAVFNAIYSRTNPGALSSSQKSSLSTQISSTELVVFLNDYTLALEDDMLEEIWVDCATFMREVLGNPMPHRQILIKLLQFCSILSQKMENTNFSEESRMSRELADICARLFTAIFTVKPAGFDGSELLNASPVKAKKGETSMNGVGQTQSMLTILLETLPHVGLVLSQYDRAATVFSGISTNIISPALHARSFPQNLTVQHLEVMRLMSASSKSWRKDVLDSFTNPKIFQSPHDLAKGGWLPLIKQLQLNDKTTITDFLNRVAPPAAAGIMLGIGASAARAEADKKTQLELRRTATLILAGDFDGSLAQLPLILQKIEELFSATLESSPSLATRSDVYLLIRTLLLKVSHANLSPLWPILDVELQDLCNDIIAGKESKYSAGSKLQGAKLLDLLLLMRPDEFQLHEWVFVTDTIDAIYPSDAGQVKSYADEIAPALNTEWVQLEALPPAPHGLRRPWLHGHDLSETKEVDVLLAEFFGQLSIRAFEDLYSLQPLDEEACRQDLLADVFTDVTS